MQELNKENPEGKLLVLMGKFAQKIGSSLSNCLPANGIFGSRLLFHLMIRQSFCLCVIVMYRHFLHSLHLTKYIIPSLFAK